MAFGIIRARNLQNSDLGTTDRHNARRYETPERFPSNIDPNRPSETKYLKPGSEYLDKHQATLAEAVKARIQSEGVKGMRKNTNVAIEYVATINDQRVWENYSPEAFFSNTATWLENRHGKGSVVAMYEHFDETNPHAHFVVVPIIEKEVKWKNRNGQGSRVEKRLNVRDHTGGPEKLRDLQNGFYKHLVERYGAGENNKFQMPLYRGTLKENQTREYIQATIASIGEIRAKLATLSDPIARKELTDQIEMKRAEKSVNEAKLKQIEQHKRERGKNWASKGTKENPTVFHPKNEEVKKTPKDGLKR